MSIFRRVRTAAACVLLVLTALALALAVDGNQPTTDRAAGDTSWVVAADGGDDAVVGVEAMAGDTSW
jgi:hypothetical protein